MTIRERTNIEILQAVCTEWAKAASQNKPIDELDIQVDFAVQTLLNNQEKPVVVEQIHLENEFGRDGDDNVVITLEPGIWIRVHVEL